MNVFIFNLKKSLLPITTILFLIFLIIFSNNNIEAAQNGLALWATAVVPSLFPFFVATELLYSTNIISFLEKYCNNLTKKLFNLPGISVFPIIMGTISGYPTGAKIVSNLRLDKKISKTEGEHLLCFTNNSGPLFILGTVGISIFCNYKIGIILLITHILASFSVGYIFKFWKKNRNFYKHNFHNASSTIENNIGIIIVNSITKSITTILNIGGFIVFFSVIISILKQSNFLLLISKFLNIFGINSNLSENFLIGIIELTSGIKSLSIIGIKNLEILILSTSFLLGFGGISVLLQVYSIISKTDLSIKPYFFGKILHGIISAIYCYIIIKIF